ncbi:hypothetical protein M407DRAFT_3737 [Tulasnella calospora MUT 4182]|uniref:Uncharacterized protein n=1 Tax=Tulasnella calospora MUT 4182 TaxID=1051891 RepID=A0A0C3QXY6_9AGAM|nr:hypothetical protein M407DRAFT_3737 [Tulasnella calospora MUT 4182]
MNYVQTQTRAVEDTNIVTAASRLASTSIGKIPGEVQTDTLYPEDAAPACLCGAYERRARRNPTPNDPSKFVGVGVETNPDRTNTPTLTQETRVTREGVRSIVGPRHWISCTSPASRTPTWSIPPKSSDPPGWTSATSSTSTAAPLSGSTVRSLDPAAPKTIVRTASSSSPLVRSIDPPATATSSGATALGAPDYSAADSQKQTIPTAVGVSVGGAVAIALLAALVFSYFRNNSKRPPRGAVGTVRGTNSAVIGGPDDARGGAQPSREPMSLFVETLRDSTLGERLPMTEYPSVQLGHAVVIAHDQAEGSYTNEPQSHDGGDVSSSCTFWTPPGSISPSNSNAPVGTGFLGEGPTTIIARSGSLHAAAQ